MHRLTYTTTPRLVDQQPLSIIQSTLSSHIKNHLFESHKNKIVKKHLGNKVNSSKKAPSKCYSTNLCNTEPDISRL